MSKYISRELKSQKEFITDIFRSGSRGQHCTVYNKTHTSLSQPKIKISGHGRKYPAFYPAICGIIQILVYRNDDYLRFNHWYDHWCPIHD